MIDQTKAVEALYSFLYGRKFNTESFVMVKNNFNDNYVVRSVKEDYNFKPKKDFYLNYKEYFKTQKIKLVSLNFDVNLNFI